jgi:hypothetical protein
MLFEPAMIDAFSHALRIDMPALIQPLHGHRDGEEELFAEQEMLLDRFERETAAWIEQGRMLREELWGGIDESDRGNSNSVATVDHMISAVENRQREMSTHIEEWQRRWERVLQLSQHLPGDHYARNKAIGDRLFAALDRRYQERSDFLLFLKAVRAEIAPDARGGPTFDTPEDLGRYFDSMLNS